MRLFPSFRPLVWKDFAFPATPRDFFERRCRRDLAFKQPCDMPAHPCSCSCVALVAKRKLEVSQQRPGLEWAQSYCYRLASIEFSEFDSRSSEQFLEGRISVDWHAMRASEHLCLHTLTEERNLSEPIVRLARYWGSAESDTQKGGQTCSIKKLKYGRLAPQRRVAAYIRVA